MSFKILSRTFVSTNYRLSKTIPNNLKGKKHSSQEWLTRQLSDPYVEKAKMQNYRCRSAFKLIEMDDRLHFLSPGQVVVDCGAAPGSWTQVAIERVKPKSNKNTKGVVIGIDRLAIYPLEGAHIISNTDFTTETAQNRIREILNGRKVDMILSDMAPSATGIKEMDHENIISLCYSAFRFAAQVSNENAGLLIKVWDGKEVPIIEADLAKFYKSVRAVKPRASRSDSSEHFLLARGFKGLKTSTTNNMDIV